MFTIIRQATMLLLVLTLLTGGIYPALITGIAQLTMPSQANGSLLQVNGQTVGSALIGQSSSDPRYFWSRPSAIGYAQSATPGTLIASAASNAGSTNATLAQQVVERTAAFRQANKLTDETAVPAEMLFASASGLDPHISPQAARLQVDRVAAARALDRQKVAELVEAQVEPAQWGIFGQPRVNVLLLNLALDRLQ